MILYGAFFVISFYVWACTHFVSFIVIYTHLRCHITNDVHLILYALCEKEKIQRFSEPKKEGCNILLDVLLF
jgi:hypothetical protein